MTRRSQAKPTLWCIPNPAWIALGCGALLLFLVIVGLSSASRMGETLAAMPAAKTSSSSVAITSNGALLLVVNPDSNSLTFVDPAAQTTLLELPVGIDPRAVAITPDWPQKIGRYQV